MKIDVYEQILNPSVNATTTVKEWFNLIRKSDYTNQIIEARKDTSGEALKVLKKNLPCVTYNFRYKNYKNDANIISSTGLLFIDIDSSNFSIDKLDKSKILGYYQSVGGNGYHILVRVDGVTPSNFKTTYNSIREILSISSFLDKNAIKHSQYSVLSYDEDAFYNENPFVFTATEDLCIPIVGNIQKKKTYTYDRDTPIRFDNLDEIEIPELDGYIVNWDGFEYIRAWIPIKKKKDGRKRFLLSYATNLVWLNQHLNYEKLILILQNVCTFVFEEPLPPERIQSTLNSVLKQLSEGKLKPIYYRNKRKIVFSKKSLLNKSEKQGIVLQELAIKKTNDSIDKIQNLINNWDKDWGPITARKLFHTKHRSGLDIRISSKTINKYYKHFKKEIEEINKRIAKLDSSIKRESMCSEPLLNYPHKRVA